MKCMNRNKVSFYYALYDREEPVYDDYGNETGETRVIYGNPLTARANISPAQGETQTRQFGEDLNYDKVIVMDKNAYPIDEYTILWIDVIPELSEDGSLAVDDSGKIKTPYDYEVKKMASGLNSTAIAISKVVVGV